MKNRIPGIFSLLILLMLLFSCSRAQKEDAGMADRRIIIGFSIATDTFILERWNKDIKIFTGAAKELGAEVLFQLSAGGTRAQIDQIRYLLKQDIDILVVLPHDTSMLAGVIKEVNDQKIPVIAYDRLIQGVPISAYVSFDNVEVGRLFGRALTRKVPRGKYLIVNGSVRDNNSYLVNQGLHEILDPYIESGAVSIVDEIWLEQWSGDEATARISEILERTTDIDAISAGNDQLANSAIQLLAERRLAGKVAVVGQDADLLSCQRVVEGLQLMTVYKPISRLATRAAQISVAIARGEAPEPDRLVENGSNTTIPYFVEMPRAVFKDNMEETIIKDGFHSAEDIYRNRSREN
ncbi:sugar ABC transporter substrate-binding protein [Marispirochaeta aestuarii]|uniref:Sugar ABC transporter substrate-binding protein n=1 Tax=Marispirochaeta aestuarii TaxID=1963862 RepID=A0A1Y1RXF1_9SPIO|nr:substrate-binding domain-containing protein [Marispirochaeta aestuarii]ORC35041.1 sugar ABC transporter substrate-binding protein [Marispirochaeta aestuarii]